MKHGLALFMAVLLTTTSAWATTVYKKVDEQGNIIFSDTPMDDAQTLDVPPVPTIKLDKLRVPQSVERKDTKEKQGGSYTALTITAPQQDETFWNNAGSVNISVRATPPLQSHHRMQLLLNGEMRAGPSASDSFAFSNLFRGSYEATAQVVDNKGNILISSPPVTFHIKQSSKLN